MLQHLKNRCKFRLERIILRGAHYRLLVMAAAIGLVAAAGGFLEAKYLVQAEGFSGQSGGEVQIRDDKAGTSEQAISHWDDVGHAIEWTVTAPAGAYHLVLRYCTPKDVVRAVSVDGSDPLTVTLPETGGFGSASWDWTHTTAEGADGVAVFTLEAGQHTVSMANACGNGCNLDYLALVPVKP